MDELLKTPRGWLETLGEIVSFGSLGRVYLAGNDRDIDVAAPAAEAAIRRLEGRAGR